AKAYEFGYPGWSTPPGVLIGTSANPPPPGVYSFNQLYTSQAVIVGPSTTAQTSTHTATEANGLLYVPGWSVLGGKYDAVVVQPFGMADAEANASLPTGMIKSGIHNTFLAPINLSWSLGQTG